jgi:hypothetical protein
LFFAGLEDLEAVCTHHDGTAFQSFSKDLKKGQIVERNIRVTNVDRFIPLRKGQNFCRYLVGNLGREFKIR